MSDPFSLPGYDAWKLRSDMDDAPDFDESERERGCTCQDAKGDRNCPVHGIDPDAEYERRRDDDAFFRDRFGDED